MNRDANQDLLATNTLVSYLYSGYQGYFTYLNILLRLNFVAFDQAHLAHAKEVLVKILPWKQDLLRGICLISASWESPITFESQEALKLLDQFRFEALSHARELGDCLALHDLSADPESSKKLLASIGRFYYAKENYLKGFVEFGSAHNFTELVHQNAELLQSSANEIKFTHALLERFNQEKPNLSREFLSQLRYQAQSLPGSYRALCHDINQLLWHFKGGFSYEALELDPVVLQAWKDLNVAPGVIGYWEAFGIGPQEALDWGKAGFDHHELAAAWKLHGFRPEAAAEWSAKGFPPLTALQWSEAGYDLEQALEKIEEMKR